MPRGFGKDTLAECAVLHALLYGRRRYVVLIAAMDPLAASSLKKIKAELAGNDLLAEDFPEVCFPIRRLEGIHNRASGQTLDGRPTRMEITAESIVLPTVTGSVSGGSVIQVAGLTGALRGRSVLASNGEPLRPDMVIVNDPQTRESAKSPYQTKDRERIISDDVLYLAGPTTPIACVMLATVIYRGDLTDRFLDGEKHPDWHSVRTRTIESWPTHRELWDRFSEIRRDAMRSGDKTAQAATDCYVEHREKMDAGCVVSWLARVKSPSISGIQTAMAAYCDNPTGFMSEAQNDPAKDGSATTRELITAEVCKRIIRPTEVHRPSRSNKTHVHDRRGRQAALVRGRRVDGEVRR